MASKETIHYHLQTRAGFRALQFDHEDSWHEQPSARETFLWRVEMQLQSVSNLLYIDYPYTVPFEGRLEMLEGLLRQRGIEYQELRPTGIEGLWYRLERARHMTLRIGGIPLTDDSVLSLALWQALAWDAVMLSIYAVDGPMTPWSKLFEKEGRLEQTRQLLSAFFGSQPNPQYLELLNECVCAVYEMDMPYPNELHSVKLSAEQMLAIFSEAASQYGVAIAEGGERQYP